jgi:hypothetical protein
MAFVPGFEHDIFVSYARIDDVPIVEGRGWVSTFVYHLKALLAQRLGRAEMFSVWMDQRQIGNEPFSDALLQHISQSAALIIILSPGYLHSEWCRAEANAFLEAIRERPHPYPRVFVLQTQQTDRELWPLQFRDVSFYPFWEPSDGTRSLTEGSRPEEYISRIESFTTDLVHVMRALAESPPKALPSEALQLLPLDLGASNLVPDDTAWYDEKRGRGEYDVFLCHNAEDKPAVKKIGELLIGKRVVPWLDEWDLRPGLAWQDALEAQIGEINSAAVFVGGSGFGPWQNMELAALLREFVFRRCPVIPVILSTCENLPQLPTFLRGLTWVDFRRREPEPMDQLVWGITGNRPPARLARGP